MTADAGLTYMTDAHRRVVALLERRGLGVQEEINFPPYKVDIYLPDFHVAVEVDGPLHTARADRRRDRALNAEYGLYVFHIPAKNANAPDKWAYALGEFLRYANPTKVKRWGRCEMKTPWI